jgi:hypothetical protein
MAQTQDAVTAAVAKIYATIADTNGLILNASQRSQWDALADGIVTLAQQLQAKPVPPAVTVKYLFLKRGNTIPVVVRSGDTIDEGEYRVETKPSVVVGSVSYGPFAGRLPRYENVAPYTLFVNNAYTKLSAGEHTLVTTCHSGSNKSGAVLVNDTLRVTVKAPVTTPTTPTVPVTNADYGDKAADLKAFLARPVGFDTTELALKWDRAFFGSITGCRTPAAMLKTVDALVLQDGTIDNPRIYRNLNILSAVKFSGRKYVWLVDCRIKGGTDPGGGYCVTTGTAEPVGCKVLHCDLYGAGAATVFAEGASKAGEFEVSWCRHYNCGADAIKGRHYVRCWANWVYHPMGQNAGAHTDGLQLADGHHEVDCQLMFYDVPNGLPGTSSNAAGMFAGTAHHVVFKYIIVNGGNKSIQAHAEYMDIDYVWYYKNSAQYGLLTGGKATSKIGSNFFDAKSGAKIDPRLAT